MIRADKDDTVTLHYTGRLEDGTIFDQSDEDRPLTMILGKKEVIAGFEEAVTGMYHMEEKTVTVAPEKAYGAHDPALVEKIALSELPAGVNLHVGHQLEVTTEKGDILLVMIVDLDDTHVTLDGNHPLAGKNLIFDIQLIQVDKKSAA